MTDAGTDPIHSPDGYRRMLLGYLADDDPAGVQAATVARLRELVAEAGPTICEPARSRRSGRSSSASATSSIRSRDDGARVRWILAEDEPEIIAYDQDLLGGWAAPRRRRPRGLIALFEACARANLALLRPVRRPTSSGSGGTRARR